MLVLTRKLGEKILIGDDIVLTIVRVNREKVRIGIDAPASVLVHREELRAAINAGPEEAAGLRAQPPF